MADAGSSPDPVHAAASELVLGCGLGLMVGFVLPLSAGLAVPLLVAGAALWLDRWRRRDVDAALRQHSLSALLGGSLVQRVAFAAIVVLPAVVIGTVAARAIGALWIAFPGAIVAAAVIVVGAAIVGRISRPPVAFAVALVVAAAIPVAAVVGHGYERDGPQAHGFAHSGPILGIHPFQTTAVVVDGYGPFDIPLNDYVEPDASRGYGAEEFAAALQTYLHRVAQQQFADGPANARLAFAGATVNAYVTPAVRERLEHTPEQPVQPRVVVESGTVGLRSTVQFVCPGGRDDPRGLTADPVMNRTCPDKYASEASAGLGMTGRWAGYAEGRGQARLRFWPAWSGPRTDGQAGREVLERERRGWAAAVLVVVLLFAGRGGAGARGASIVGGVVAALGVCTVVVAVLAAGPAAQVGAIESAASWSPAFDVAAWLPALLLLGGLGAVAVGRGPTSPGRGPLRIRAGGVVAIMVVVATVGAATSLPVLDWVHPRIGSPADALGLERFVRGLAGTIESGSTVALQALEAAIAAVLVAGLWSVAVAGVRAGTNAVTAATGTAATGTAALGWLATAGIVAGSAALLVSRKTDGATALLPGTIAMTVLVATSLWVLARRHRAAAGGPGIIPKVVHVAAIVVTLTLLGVALFAGGPPTGFLVACLAVGAVAAVSALSLLWGGERGVAAAPKASIATGDDA